MADFYWIGALSIEWDTIGNWSDTSGGDPSASTPGAGDTAIFDGASAASPNPVPGAYGLPIQLAVVMQGYNLNIDNLWTTTQPTYLRMETGTFNGTWAPGASADFYGNSVNAAPCADGVNFSFYDSATNNGELAVGVFTLGFGSAGTPNNAAAVSCNSFIISTNVAATNSATITAAAFCSINGSITGGNIVVNGIPCQIRPNGNVQFGTVITGNVDIDAGGYCNALINGNVTCAGSVTGGTITGNLMLSAGASSLGSVFGTVTAPGIVNGDGTIGSTAIGLGIYGALKLTGISVGGGTSTNVFGLPV